MRNNIFKTAALAGLFFFMLAFLGAFSGITTSVHATHADEVDTEAELKEFVEAAVDEYYLEFLAKKRCDFRKLNIPSEALALLPSFGVDVTLTDLSPESIQELSTEQLKTLVRLFGRPEAKAILGDKNVWDACTPLPGSSTFRTVFEEEEGRWKSESGSIYLFVAQYMDATPRQSFIFHGGNMDLENEDVTGLEDASSPPVRIMDLVREAADGQVQGREKGFLCYRWDDPGTDDDNIDNMGNILRASGNSWKIGYVVDPFTYLGVPPLDSRRVIFGSGIYPEEELESCTVGTTGPPPATGSGGGGGGCAIAAGSDSTPQGTAFNLLLMVSVLLLTVSFRRRAMDRRRNRISS